MTISIKKTHVYWTAIFVSQVLLITYLQGLLTSDNPVIPVPAPLPSELKMTQQEADLVRSAIELVRDDVVAGTLTSTALTLQALSSMLPSSVRAAVLKELGTPDMDFMRDALDILKGKLPRRKTQTLIICSQTASPKRPTRIGSAATN
jgi:hypothetical protein